MARIESWTRNGDYQVTETSDPDKIRKLENAPSDEASNIARTRVTED